MPANRSETWVLPAAGRLGHGGCDRRYISGLEMAETVVDVVTLYSGSELYHEPQC